MSNQEAIDSARREKRALLLWRVAELGLLEAVEHAGGTLYGFSAKVERYQCLLTLRAVFPAGGVICFVGGDTVGTALVKAYREAKSDSLRWKVDKYYRG